MNKVIASCLVSVVILACASRAYAADQNGITNSLFDTQLHFIDPDYYEQTENLSLPFDQNLNVIPIASEFQDSTFFDITYYNPHENIEPKNSLKKISITFLYILPGFSIEIGYPSVFEGISFELDLFLYPGLIYFVAFDLKYSFRIDPTFSFGLGFEIAQIILVEEEDVTLIAPFIFFKIPYGFNKIIEITVGLARVVYYSDDDEYDDDDDFKWTPAMEFSFGIHF